jgi:hypothetical protein
MAHRSLSAVSLWRVTTTASVVECTLEPLSSEWCELRVSQDRDILFSERFASPETAKKYATLLRHKVERLATATTGDALHS